MFPKNIRQEASSKLPCGPSPQFNLNLLDDTFAISTFNQILRLLTSSIESLSLKCKVVAFGAVTIAIFHCSLFLPMSDERDPRASVQTALHLYMELKPELPQKLIAEVEESMRSNAGNITEESVLEIIQANRYVG